jgi:flagellar FliL protein
MILPILFAQPSSEDAKVNLDQEKLADDIPKGLQKVDLDLDDALFLEEEEKKDEPEPQTLPTPQAEPAPAARPFWKNPKILIALGVLLLAGIGGVMFFLSSPEEPPVPVAQVEEPPVQEHNASRPTEQKDNATEPTVPLFAFSPFQVEHIQGERVRLLTCRFGVPDAAQTLAMEMRFKEIILRDGVYRYLKNTPLSFLDDPENSEKLKADIVTVLNQNLQSGQISSILLEEYVVQ